MRKFVFFALLIGSCSLGMSCTNTDTARTPETDGQGLSPVNGDQPTGTSVDDLKAPESVTTGGTTVDE